MKRTRRAALTATLATTAALSIAGVSWGIGTTVAGQAPARSEGYSLTVDDTVEAAAGQGLGSGRGGAGRGAGPARGNGYGSGGSGASTPDQVRAGGGAGYGRGAAQGSGTCAEDGTGSGSGRGPGGTAGTGPGSGTNSDVPDAIPGATISDEVTGQLVYLVEEEKLAGDVYALAESLYGDRVFINIGQAEDHHADEVRLLLDRYGVEDPTIGAGAGEFTDPELQALYDTVADQVRDSRADAIAAGILIEQTDIADLQVLAAGGLPDDVSAVVDNLLAGSQRHLAAFQRQAA